MWLKNENTQNQKPKDQNKLSERSQSQKTTYYMIPFLRKVQNEAAPRDREEMSGCLELGVRGRGGEMQHDQLLRGMGAWG